MPHVAGSERAALERGEVHVWTARIPVVADAAAVCSWEALESADERARRLRLGAGQDRVQRLVGVALVRTTLSRYAAAAPADWVFERSPRGRPELAPGPQGAGLRFNLSHAEGLAACAVALGRDVGVDVEHSARRGDVLAIAERYFATGEADALRALPEPSRRRRFFEHWTLRECYVKARGVGMALPFRGFAFTLDDGPPRILFHQDLGDDAGQWQFALFAPTPVHVLAVGVRRGRGADLAIRLRQGPLLAP
jgi:4'-phosphopantetheinyl transferase